MKPFLARQPQLLAHIFPTILLGLSLCNVALAVLLLILLCCLDVALAICTSRNLQHPVQLRHPPPFLYNILWCTCFRNRFQTMNYRREDVPVDMCVIPRGEGKGDAEDQEQLLLVLSTKGYGKRVDTNEFRTTKRWGLTRIE